MEERLARILSNPTLYPLALTPRERSGAFKWHTHATSARSSQVFCLSAFGTLRNIDGGGQVLSSLLSEAFPMIAEQTAAEPWDITPEYEDGELLNEKGVNQPTSVDVLCVSASRVVCIESKFVSDAKKGFGACGQAEKGLCAGFRGPGSDRHKGSGAWCRLENWEGRRSPRTYWSLGKSYFQAEIFARQSEGEVCAFAGPSYQIMRNFLLAAAMAERERKSFFTLAICPERHAEVAVGEIEDFREKVLLPRFRDRLEFLPYERLIFHLRQSTEGDAIALAEFLEARITEVD